MGDIPPMPQTNPPIEDVAAAIEAQAREIFATELERVSEPFLASRVRDGSDNSRGGQAAIAALVSALTNQIACPSGGEGDEAAVAKALAGNQWATSNRAIGGGPCRDWEGYTPAEQNEGWFVMARRAIAALARAGGSEVRRDALEDVVRLIEEWEGEINYTDELVAAIRALSDQEGDGR